MERERQEEAKRLQEIADKQLDKLRSEVSDLKANELRLKSDLKLTQEEAKMKLSQAKR